MCEDGDVEPHPGPARKLEKKEKNIKVVTINTGGATGAWKALDTCTVEDEDAGTKAKDAICIQELCLSDKEWKAFEGVAAGKGYKGYHQEGNTSTQIGGAERSTMEE